MTRSLWKGPFIKTTLLKQVYNQQKNKVSFQSIKVWSRNSVIFPSFVGIVFEVYNGKKFLVVLVKKSMVGLKFGEFVLTRKLTKHKK